MEQIKLDDDCEVEIKTSRWVGLSDVCEGCGLAENRINHTFDCMDEPPDTTSGNQLAAEIDDYRGEQDDPEVDRQLLVVRSRAYRLPKDVLIDLEGLTRGATPTKTPRKNFTGRFQCADVISIQQRL